jgi:hypothetical protein
MRKLFMRHGVEFDARYRLPGYLRHRVWFPPVKFGKVPQRAFAKIRGSVGRHALRNEGRAAPVSSCASYFDEGSNPRGCSTAQARP